MVKPYTMRLITLALLLGGGLPLLADAQQTPAVPPTHGASPQSSEPPPVHGAQPRYQAPAPSHVAPSPPENIEASRMPPDGSARVQTEGGIRYVSGGIGLSERDDLSALSDQFNLRLMFAIQGSGNYLADIQVRILDSGGATVLDAISQGPYFLAQLPPGGYTVEAGMLGQTQRQTVRVGSGQSQLNFYWR